VNVTETLSGEFCDVVATYRIAESKCVLKGKLGLDLKSNQIKQNKI